MSLGVFNLFNLFSHNWHGHCFILFPSFDKFKVAARKKEFGMDQFENMKDVYQITEREGKKAIWTRIGSAFINKDKSLNVLLNSIPLDGRLHIRDRNQKEKE